METEFIKMIIECVALGIVSVIGSGVGFIFRGMLKQMEQIKQSVMDLNIKIAEILVKTESHHERLERLETYRRRTDSGS